MTALPPPIPVARLVVSAKRTVKTPVEEKTLKLRLPIISTPIKRSPPMDFQALTRCVVPIPNTCAPCKKTFADAMATLNHVMSMPGHYYCTHCMSVFTQLQHLQYHMRLRLKFELPHCMPPVDPNPSLSQGNCVEPIYLPASKPPPKLKPLCDCGQYHEDSDEDV